MFSSIYETANSWLSRRGDESRVFWESFCRWKRLRKPLSRFSSSLFLILPQTSARVDRPHWENHISPNPCKNPFFLFQSEKWIGSRIRGHNKGEGPVEFRIDAEIDDPLEDSRVIVIQPYDEGSHDTDSLSMNPFDRFRISGWLVESLSHRFQVLCWEGLKTDIDSDTTTLRKSFQELLIKGDGNRGMAIPEKIEFFKKGEKLKAKSLIPCDVGIDDVKESSFEKVGRSLLNKERIFLTQSSSPVPSGRGFWVLAQFRWSGDCGIEIEKFWDTTEVTVMRTSPRGFK